MYLRRTLQVLMFALPIVVAAVAALGSATSLSHVIHDQTAARWLGVATISGLVVLAMIVLAIVATVGAYVLQDLDRRERSPRHDD